MESEKAWYIEQFKERALRRPTSATITTQQLRRPTSKATQEDPLVWVFTWRKDFDPSMEGLSSIHSLTHDSNYHLRIITLPRASPWQLPEFEYLYSLFQIPSGFVSEILQDTTHSFGTDGLGNQSYTIWARLLSIIPSKLPKEKPNWLSSSLILKQNVSSTDGQRQILLVLFSPPEKVLLLINNLFNSSKWDNVLKDPFMLFNMVFEAWYLFVDQNAWTVLDRVTETETDLFEQSRRRGVSKKEKLAVDYTDIHLLAKDAIHLTEGVDATLRSLNRVLDAHDELKTKESENEEKYKRIQTSTTEALKHQVELFQSTRLRLSSVDKRLQNVINLAFNLSTSHDSKVMLGDSYAMRTLSFLALVFLPISTVSTIFGSQFFGTDVVALPNGSSRADLVVSSQLWILWAVSIPITLFIVTGWLFWLRYSQRRFDLSKKESLA